MGVQQNNVHFDFSTRQKLSDSGFWVHSFIGLGKTIKNLIVAFIYLIIKYPKVFITWQFWSIFLALGILYLIISYLYHTRFSFWVDEKNQEFIVNKGLFNKTQIVLKFDNIQQVNIKQNIIQQALDLYAIEIESAGSAEKEVNLYALDEDKALAFKEYLTKKRLGNLVTTHLDQTEEFALESKNLEHEPTFQISNKKILFISLFTNYEKAFGLFVLFLFGLWDTLHDLSSWTNNFMDWGQNIESALELSLVILISFVITFFMIPLIINIFKYLIRYYGFKLFKQNNGNLTMQFGLFEIQNIVLNREKIQMVSYLDNWILRKKNLAVITLHQINVQVTKQDASRIYIPGIEYHQSENLISDILGKHFPGLWNKTYFQKLAPKIGLLLIRFFWITLLSITLTYIGIQMNFGFLSWMATTLILCIFYFSNYLYYKNYQLFKAPGFLIKISGIWDITRTILPLQKIQSVRINQNFIQKKTGTAHISVSTASGVVTFSYLPYLLAVELSNQILFEIEAQD